MEQGSDAWLKWRSAGLGGSDYPIIMGDSVYKTPYQLFMEKIGEAKDEFSDYQIAAMARGHEWEPKIREMVEKQIGVNFTPRIYMMSQKDYLRVSLDGWSDIKEMCLEIKYASKEDHADAVLGNVPKKYKAQVQGQMMVTDTCKALYASYNEKINDLKILTVERDSDYIKELEKKCSDFWLNNIVARIPPALTDRDYVTVNDFEVEMLVEKYLSHQNEMKSLTDKMQELKDKITEKLPHSACQVGAARIYKQVRKGNINYKDIPQLKEINLENYRGSPIEFWTVKS